MVKYCVPAMKARGGRGDHQHGERAGTPVGEGHFRLRGEQGGATCRWCANWPWINAEDNIRVVAVNPGTIETPLLQEAIDSIGGDEDEIRTDMASRHAVNRPGAVRRTSPMRCSFSQATALPSSPENS